MPNAAALASEYVPLRRRPFAVTLTIVCIPIGGTLAGFTGALVLPAYGWRALFPLGGSPPPLPPPLPLAPPPQTPPDLRRPRAPGPRAAPAPGRVRHTLPPPRGLL